MFQGSESANNRESSKGFKTQPKVNGEKHEDVTVSTTVKPSSNVESTRLDKVYLCFVYFYCCFELLTINCVTVLHRYRKKKPIKRTMSKSNLILKQKKENV